MMNVEKEGRLLQRRMFVKGTSALRHVNITVERLNF